MKKIICLMLCIVMLSLTLVSCGKDVIGEDLDGYYEEYQPEVKEELELDFYIIYEEGTTENAITTVERMINSYLSEKFLTTLDMHYLTAEEYEATVKADVNKTGKDRADIVLINSKKMFDELNASHALANITEFLDTKEFGKLNTQIAGPLMKATEVKEHRFTHNNVKYDVWNRYMIPNNHIIGSYDYILIDKNAARALNFSNEKLYAMNTYESTLELREALTATGANAADLVKEVKGTFDAKAAYESEGYICNIAAYPTVDEEEAFMSGFAVVRAENDTSYERLTDQDPNADPESIIKYDESYKKTYKRCMEVIYAFNSDEYLRNLLQYGVRGTNYSIDENNVVDSYKEGSGVYNMNIIYTGDVFKAYYNTIGWNERVAASGVEQNKEAVLPTPAEK